MYGQINILLGIVNKVSNCILLHKPGLGQEGAGKGGVRGGFSLIWPQRECAAAQGMIFRVLGLKQGIQFFYLMS